MKTWFVNWWDAFRTSFWFVPTVLALAAIVLALIMPELDRWISEDAIGWFGRIVTTAAAARLSLSSIAGAMITVTGVVFSITIVALANTAAQFGSRLLRKTMEDVLTHLALGCMVATSLYCLLILRLIHDEENSTFVPHLSVALGIVMAIGSMGVFIMFIHGTAVRLQAPNLVQAVAAELCDVIDRLFPKSIGESPNDAAQDDVATRIEELGDGFAVVSANGQGYLQAVNGSGLLDLATEKDVVVYAPNRPGMFLSEDSPVVQVWPKRNVDKDLGDKLRTCFIIGHMRTPRQDVECAVNELVEIAVRALSPGINDPFTAMTCLDYLGAAMSQLASRSMPSHVRMDDKDNVRFLAEPICFGDILQSAFRMILHFGHTNPEIIKRFLNVAENLARHLRRKEDRTALSNELERAQAIIGRNTNSEPEWAELEERCRKIRQSLAHP